jgi:anti-sigma factor RsiW
MSDNPLQHELDDELLSAYLDDELSEAERAIVEARLAADPAARQTLEELRRVSQAVRGLPQASLPRDLAESIVRRAAEAKRAAVPRPGDANLATPPTFTIGRTRRAWIWASLAVAASLLIMFTQREPVDDDAGKSVAMRREPPSLTAAPEFAPSGSPDHAADQLVESEAATRAGGGEGSVVSASESAEGFAAAAPTEPMGALDDDQLVVVHVLAKRAALENKAFDQLLVSNGIAVDLAAPVEEPNARHERSRTLSGRVAEQPDTPAPADSEADVDVVLVEAPTPTIESCLKELNQDYANYVGVEVQGATPAAGPSEEPLTPQAAPVKKLAVDLGQYSRGIISRRQKESFAREQTQYYQQANEGRYAGRGSSLDAASGMTQKEKLQDRRDSFANQGRAQRVVVAKTKPLQLGQLRKLAPPLNAPAEPAGDNLQVLFVLTPSDEPAASPAAESRAE